MKLFQYAIIKHPTDDEKDKGATSTIVVPITTTLAPDANAAAMLAGRAIPEAELGNLARLEVAVRPFDVAPVAQAASLGQLETAIDVQAKRIRSFMDGDRNWANTPRSAPVFMAGCKPHATYTCAANLVAKS